MKHVNGKIFFGWIYSRRVVIIYAAAVYAVFFIVYALYGYEWGVAGYAALISAAAGLGFAAWDIVRFASKHITLSRMEGRFPTSPLPQSGDLPEEDARRVINALETERARLESENERTRRDAEEYYTLWVHQIKTPIAAMRLLLQSGDAGATGENNAALEQELFKISQYADMALQYQRLSSMNNDLIFHEYALDKLIKKAAKNCATLFIGKKLSLNIERIDKFIITDEKWFCFVLEQIFTNAVKYTPAGSVRVYTPDSETLAVEDDGIGIMPEDLPRVFERGFTGAAGRSERSSTGIGLYLCREILTRLGFGINIFSEPGKGTRVLLLIRQDAADAE